MKRVKLFLSALLLSLSSLFALVAPHAFAATRTWDGGGGDDNMTTAANWSGDVAPSAGDDLVFPVNLGTADRLIDNDFSAGTSFNSIVFSGAATSESNYTITGNAMVVVAGINNSMTGSTINIYQDVNLALTLGGSQTFQAAGGSLTLGGTLNLSTHNLTVTTTGSILLDGVISGSGNITKSGTGALYLSGANASYSGDITASAGSILALDADALGATSGETIINAGADLVLGECAEATIDEDITLTGASSDADNIAKLTAGVGCAGGGGGTENYGSGVSGPALTLSGDITLGSNITLSPVAGTTTLTGALNGNFSIEIDSGYKGQLVINSSPNNSKMSSGTHKSPTLEVTLSDDQSANSVVISGNTIVTLDGKRGDISVNSGATLKGTGEAAVVIIAEGGTIAPGHSPGCLTTTGLTVVGTFTAELGGTTACSGYDQSIVNGAVDVTGGTLSAQLYNNFKPAAGQKYTIISNDGSDAVTGTFEGLAQGATFTVNGYTLSVSYTGGDGNDVQLTVTAVPPDTGFELLTSNPYVTMSLMLGAAGAIAFMARRSLKPARRRH